MAAEELADLVRLGAKLKLMKAELRAAVEATGSHLMDIIGLGPAGAARILADVGDVARFPDRNHFASKTGTGPAPHPSMPPPVNTCATGYRGPGRSGGSGRALGDDSALQRDRPDPGHRLFGQATFPDPHP